jgi:hypothetical protein
LSRRPRVVAGSSGRALAWRQQRLADIPPMFAAVQTALTW